MTNQMKVFLGRRRDEVSRDLIEPVFADKAIIKSLWLGLIAQAQARLAQFVGRDNAMQCMIGTSTLKYRPNPGAVFRRVPGEIEYDRHSQLK